MINFIFYRWNKGILLIPTFCIYLSACGLPSLQRMIDERDTGNPHEALRIATEVIEKDRPTIAGAGIYAFAINQIASIAFLEGFNQETDMKVEELYRRGISEARSGSESRIAIIHAYARYYSNTSRPGIGSDHLLEAIEYDLASSDQYEVAGAFGSLSIHYLNLGDLELGDYYRDRANERYARYFKASYSSGLRENNRWLEFTKSLRKSMSIAARRSDFRKLNDVWNIWKDIGKDNRFYKPFIPYYLSAQYFAQAGFSEVARNLISQAKLIFKKDLPNLTPEDIARSQSDIRCIELEIEIFSEQMNLQKLLDECFALREQTKLPFSVGHFIDAGLTFELLGEYSKSAEMFRRATKLASQVRSSFGVWQRASAFNQAGTQEAYHGLYRVLARRAQHKPDDRNSFFLAVAAGESFKSRQLSELAGTDTVLTPQDYASLQRILPPRTVIISLTAMKNSVVVAALSSTKRRIRVVSINRVELELRYTEMLQRVQDPRSNRVSLHRALRENTSQLLQSFADMIDSSSKLVFVMDGPMAVLPGSLFYSRKHDRHPIGTQRIVVRAPAMRHLALGTQIRQSNGGLWVLGDPEYPNSVRLVSELTRTQRQTSNRSRLRSINGGEVIIQRLPETRTEVNAISELFSERPIFRALGSDATESAIKQGDFRSVSFLHLATHGVVGNDIPGLTEPALILAEERGEDSFLRASEVEKLDLSGVSVTVLSACNTGSGRRFNGEGIMGLGRAFLVAGSEAVVMSMWPVESSATTAFMFKFYRKLKTTQDIEQALYETMTSLYSQGRPPSEWAPFVLIKQ